MKNLKKTIPFLFLLIILACKKESKKEEPIKLETPKLIKGNYDLNENPHFVWEGANVYFLLTDRFKNGDTSNDIVLNRTKKAGKLRKFEGGDIKGIIKKIEDGYFRELGINVIWISPIVEQVHGLVGDTYSFHGYWAKDWTKIDPNFGTSKEFKNFIKIAHQNGIRILFDVVLNHTGPVTSEDPLWPYEWVRTDPKCTYDNYYSTIRCTLAQNFPDIITESNKEVKLPEALIAKWKSEGRYEFEIAELDIFFTKTGLKRSPQNYIIKWLTDYIREFGIDGYRVDTVKHVEENIWKTLAEQAKIAFTEWKSKNQDQVVDDNDFYLVGEVYNYSIDEKREFNFGDRKVDYYANGFDNLINFQFKHDATLLNYEELFSKYSQILNTTLISKSVVNYISSHDDSKPFDKMRRKTFESATKLLLTPGVSQVYYGDEIARPLSVSGTHGDASLRSLMNWDSMENNETKVLLNHWQKLGLFRKYHPAIGAGKHKMISELPYLFSREYNKNGISDKVLVGLDLSKGKKSLKIDAVFPEGTKVIDQYSGIETVVVNDSISIDSDFEIILLESKK